MPELTSNSDQHLVPLDVPPWLARSVAPWRIEAAALWRAGVMLDLRSDRARIPVLVKSAAAGPLSMSLLDPRIPAKPGAALVRALNARMQHAAPLRGWLLRLRELAAMLDASGLASSGGELAVLIEGWRAWPAREANPGGQVAALPDAVRAASAALPRATRAALVLHRFARAELVEALTDWEALGSADGNAGFTELLLDAVALGVLGRRDEAADSLVRAEAFANTADAWLTLARGYEAHDRREAAIVAHEQVLARRGGDWDRLRLARARGGFAAGEPVPRPRPDASAQEQISIVRELLKILEAAGRYDDSLAVLSDLIDTLGEAVPSELVVRAAELHLWRGELAQACARLDAAPGVRDDPKAEIVRGAVAVLDGRAAEGLARLEAIETEGATPLELLLWKAEAHLALEQPSAAMDCVDQHILLENSLVAYLFKLLVLIMVGPHETLDSLFESRIFLDALLVDVLPTMRPAAQIAAAREQPERFAALIRGILDDMGGNRGPKPTWCRRDADGAVRLERVVVRPSGRDAAVANLIRIRTETPEQVLAGFEAVLREYPNSPHPCTYRGELLIWLGRYDQALASFDESDARAPTRWAYVGRAAAYDLIGEAELADHWTLEGTRRFGELETATTHVYRGERRRKLGEWDAARRDLEIALALKTRRFGARINLALVYRALGLSELYDQQIARLRADAPAFVWEAGGRADRPIDEATLLAMLELMVGNRSSFLHTLIDGEGRFRVIPDPGEFVAYARLSLAGARDEFGRVIAARWLG